MNVLAIHTTHDGCMTYVKNNKIIFHTQLDRYNRFKHTTFPVKLVFEILDNIKVDKILITSLGLKTLPSTPLWKDMLKDSKLKNVKIIFYDDYYHHLFHAYCGLTWNKKLKNILVCDGSGAKYGDNLERESLYFYNKKLEHVSTESNGIGIRYELFTKKHFTHF